ncbi:hypothetical protein ACFSHQ_26600 [Gemmobacter lanyuensis]
MIQSGLFCVILSQHVTHPGPDMYPISFTLAALFAMALEARAEGFVPVTDRDTFIELVSTRELRHPFGIRLIVSPDGQISGNAMGWPVSGTWNWTDGFFCREMEWSGTPFPSTASWSRSRQAENSASPWTGARGLRNLPPAIRMVTAWRRSRTCDSRPP